MGKRVIFLFSTLIFIVGVLIWQLPTILRALPSRYVAAMPQSLQAIGVRSHVEALPTAAMTADTSALLLPTATPKILPPPPTFVSVSATPNFIPTATPTPLPTPTPTLSPIPATARLNNLTHYFQEWNNCGPATLATALSYYGLQVQQGDVASFLKPDPEDRNVSPYEIVHYVEQQTAFKAVDRTNGDLDTLRRLVAAGFPVMVEVGLYPPGEYAWLDWFGHYLLVVAYEDDSQQFWVYDSWLGTSEVPRENAHDQGRIFSYADVDEMWRHFNRNYIVVYPPERTLEVTAIIGDDMNDTVMWQDALTQMQTELQSEPDNAFLWFNLGTIYTAQEDFEAASIAFDKARAIGLPWRMLWYQFGPYEAYYQTQRYEEIILLADTTLQNRPYFEESFYYKALAQIALGQTEDAQRNLQQAINFNPNFTPAITTLAELTN